MKNLESCSERRSDRRADAPKRDEAGGLGATRLRARWLRRGPSHSTGLIHHPFHREAVFVQDVILARAPRGTGAPAAPPDGPGVARPPWSPKDRSRNGTDNFKTSELKRR